MKSLALTLSGAALFAALLVAPAAAQTTFRADLDGFQETPPIPGTLAGGYALLTLNPTGSITYDVQTFGLTATVAHIHKGAVGVAGGIVFPLAGGPTNFTGTTPPLTGLQEADLRAGLYYVNVHTAANPGGEIRGQIDLNPRVFGARLDNVQEVPPTASTAKGDATMTILPDGRLTYLVTTTGLVGGTNGHIHSGTFGNPGGIEVPLAGGPTTWSGTTAAPITDGQIEMLQNLGAYVNLHTSGIPAGEIRGQIVASGSAYGPKSNPPTGVITLSSSGAPTDVGGGGNFVLSVANGKPGGTGYLFVGLDAGASLLNLEPFLLNPALLILTNLLLPLNGSGAINLSSTTPLLPSSVTVFMQFVGLDTAAPNGKFNVSNGLQMTFVHF
jgi:hypothetical protein